MRTSIESAALAFLDTALHCVRIAHLQTERQEASYTGGNHIGGVALSAILAKHRDAISCALARNGEAPTFFEVLTAAAMHHFRDEQPDCCIIEAGLGGRVDATNIFDAPQVMLAMLLAGLPIRDRCCLLIRCRLSESLLVTPSLCTPSLPCG